MKVLWTVAVGRAVRSLAFGSLLLAPTLAWSQVPHTFAPNTPALASEVNTNFGAVAGGEFINSFNADITNVETTVRTIDVTVPTAGFLIATAYGNSQCDQAGIFIVRIQNATTGAISNSTFDNRPVVNYYYYSVHFVFSVAAGVNTLNVRAYCSAGATTGNMNINTFYAIFMANRY
jgi:hypothetical protein